MGEGQMSGFSRCYRVRAILAHPDKFRACTECGAINRKGTRICVICANKGFRQLDASDKKNLRENFKAGDWMEMS